MQIPAITKAGFRELLDIIRPEISAHNDRGKPIPAGIQLFVDAQVLRHGYIPASMWRFV